jgi:hypothetical protein
MLFTELLNIRLRLSGGRVVLTAAARGLWSKDIAGIRNHHFKQNFRIMI